MPVTDNQNFLVEYVYYEDANGTLYPLFGGTRALMSWNNFGMPDIDYLSDRGPFQHGRTIRDYRVRERTITFTLYEKGCRRPDWWCNEAELIDALRPNRSSTKQGGMILVINQDNIEREIPARIQRGPSGDWNGRGSQAPEDLNESISFVCDDPFWRDPTQQTEVFTIDPFAPCLPSCLPFCLGSNGIINATQTITYTGTWDGDQIDIILIGPMISPVISNDTTGQEIKMNYTIAAGEQVTISIQPNTTTVTNNSGSNLIGTIENISDLVVFFLATKSDLTSTGDNVIRVLATGGVQGTTAIEINYYIRDISVFVPC